MAFERGALCLALAAACLVFGREAAAQAVAPKALIYSCVLNGKRLTRDRLIAECDQVEQRVMNSDGSLYKIIQPVRTEQQRQDDDACEREAEAERVARREESRRDRSKMQTYPDEASHRKSREKALDDSRNAVRKSKERIELLLKERKPLLEEAEFYVGKPLPLKVKLALDGNDAALAAQKALVQNQEEDAKRINDKYDAELFRLKKLWTSAQQPGSFYVAPPLSPGCTKAAPR